MRCRDAIQELYRFSTQRRRRPRAQRAASPFTKHDKDQKNQGHRGKQKPPTTTAKKSAHCGPKPLSPSIISESERSLRQKTTSATDGLPFLPCKGPMHKCTPPMIPRTTHALAKWHRPGALTARPRPQHAKHAPLYRARRQSLVEGSPPRAREQIWRVALSAQNAKTKKSRPQRCHNFLRSPPLPRQTRRDQKSACLQKVTG